MNKEIKIIFSVAIIAIVGMIFLIGFGPKGTKTVDFSLLVKETSHMTGKIDAKVTVVEFGDYQCPACGVFYPILKQIVDIYGSNPDFNFVYRNFPLPQHKNAFVSAEAAESAGAQGKFWEMEGLLYLNQSEWSESDNAGDIFISYAEKLKLNINKFKDDIKNSKYDSVIRSDQSDGNSLNVSWTPSIYVNGELLQDMPTFDQFKSKIDLLLVK